MRSMVATDFARRGVPWVALMTERRSVPATLNLGMRERASVAVALVAAGALAGRRPLPLTCALAATVALNTDLYRVVARRLGPGGVVAAVPLHVLHQLVAVAAVPAGVAVSVSRL